MRRQRPAIGLRVDLYGGSAVAVDIQPVGDRWPEHEQPDRLSLPVCLAALTLKSTDRSLRPRIRHLLMGTAAALVELDPLEPSSTSWAERVAGRRIIAETTAGQPRIVARLMEGRDGIAIQVRGPAPTSLALASCTAAVAGVALSATAADLHLAAALALEGVLVFFGRRESTRASLQTAACQGFGYALDRLFDAGRPAPGVLVQAAAAGRCTP
jgi:hypothetical protein